MNKENLNLLKKYIQNNISPLLIKDIPLDIFDNSIIINSDINKLELNGHYEKTEFCPPSWYSELIKKSKDKYVVLIINNINNIPLEEQPKFVELLKYRKISTFELPNNCIIIVTCTDLNINKINEEVYSLLVQI